ncbi:hypothetical protein DACRYDRAFT_25716 [Dacryopinax primogenitus]|uniref:Aminoglycoside phosphotransferase domain-containing protein n=1 Tax=Dacryopinax primogenitus (strain DJM 731) TaxID=1858805 RepID=M5FNM3_DACPD|nr:uncharacterized protein DACRYDRAFT_25716 [Dacryopinax primogenitus]EJT96463.1 hypothetical protein DACRYDRAFT_25716 [Dacryopinax primogenitus]
MSLVARVIYPRQPYWKTKAEAAVMNLVRARNVPVPKVYQCSLTASDNPVGAEWILMEYMAGERLDDVFDSPEFTMDKKKRVIRDLVQIWSDIYRITSERIGSVLPANDEDGIALSTVVYEGLKRPRKVHRLLCKFDHADAFIVGPCHDTVFVHATSGCPPVDNCGPFKDEDEWLSALAFLGIPPTRPDKIIHRGAGKKVLELVARWRRRSLPWSRSSSRSHLSHGDFEGRNILVSEDGRVTALLDWENSGLVPELEAATAPDRWNEDAQRCTGGMFGDPYEPGDYMHDGIPEDKETAELRAYFRVTLHRINPALFKAYWVGVEMRAIRLALAAPYPGNTRLWLANYATFTSTASREGKWWRVNNLEVMTPKELEKWGGQEWETVQRELLEEGYGQTSAEHVA